MDDDVSASTRTAGAAGRPVDPYAAVGAGGCGPHPGRPGRPRDVEREHAILAAALDLVTEVGYDALGVEAVAARAGVSKATVYRRWDNKAELVADAVRLRTVPSPRLPDTGDLRADLLAGLRVAVADLADHHMGLVAGLAVAMQSDPDLAALVRDQAVCARREAARDWLRRAVERGQVAADVDLELVTDLVPATVLLRRAVTGDPLDEAFLVRFVDHVLLPLLTRGGCAAGPRPHHRTRRESA